MRFNDYNAEELRKCGKELTDLLRDNIKRFKRLDEDTHAWTDFLTDWFASTARQGACVDAHAARAKVSWRTLLRDPGLADSVPQRTTRWEFMLDVVHSTFPPNTEDFYKGYFDRALGAGPLEMLLGVETEFGRRNARSANLAMVLDDSTKLALVRARAKVIVFGTENGEADQRDEIVSRLTILRRETGDHAPWLWIDLPWVAGKVQAWTPSFGVLVHVRRGRGT